jgi:hypothetical protein
MIKIDKSITLCAIDCVMPKAASRALSLSSTHLIFDKVILFSDRDVEGEHDFQKIQKIGSIGSYNRFILSELAEYIDTDFILLVQWDGYIVEPNLWTNEFLKYDYIGAKWPQYTDKHDVGNGGFSLRSRKLLEGVKSLNINLRNSIPEDEVICRIFREKLENNYDIKFAPSSIADIFSYEQSVSETPTLGFHGFWNCWQYLTDQEAISIIEEMPEKYGGGYLVAKAFMTFYQSNRAKIYEQLYRIAIRSVGEDYLSKMLVMALKYDETLVYQAMHDARKLFIKSEINNA